MRENGEFTKIVISTSRKAEKHQDLLDKTPRKKKHVGWTNIGDVGWKTVGFIHKHGEVLDFRSTNMCQLNY
jgi:hypothetical protein